MKTRMPKTFYELSGGELHFGPICMREGVCQTLPEGFMGCLLVTKTSFSLFASKINYSETSKLV